MAQGHWSALQESTSAHTASLEKYQNSASEIQILLKAYCFHILQIWKILSWAIITCICIKNSRTSISEVLVVFSCACFFWWFFSTNSPLKFGNRANTSWSRLWPDDIDIVHIVISTWWSIIILSWLFFVCVISFKSCHNYYFCFIAEGGWVICTSTHRHVFKLRFELKQPKTTLKLYDWTTTLNPFAVRATQYLPISDGKHE